MKYDDSDQRARLLEIAAKYKSYQKIDDSYRFGPRFCAPPPGSGNEHHLSRSDDEATHGRKLYLLYAKEFDPLVQSYADRAVIDREKTTDRATHMKLQPIDDQVIVKESWHPEEIKAGDAPVHIALGPKGKRYKPGGKGPLFVMYQTNPKDPNSDEGWVYGTLTPDGKTVTGVGRLENCMSCHQKAPHGRLFGLPRD